MSEYYGQVSGMSDTVASRRGSKASGIRASAQSWKGSVIVVMYNDMVSIEISEGSSISGTTYFRGTIDELKEQLGKE